MSEAIQHDKQKTSPAGDQQASGTADSGKPVAETERVTMASAQEQNIAPAGQVKPLDVDQPAAEPLSPAKVKLILEAAMLAAGQPLPMKRMLTLFSEQEQPGREVIHQALEILAGDYAKRGIELKEVANGYRLQVRQDFEPWVSRLWEERAPRYTRALLETLALMAYRQPITRGEIENIRGVSVSSSIVKTLLEREWIRVIGHRDVPGRPAMYATTKNFLDYFGLKGLEDLPALSELRDIDSLNVELDLRPPAGATKDGERSQTAKTHATDPATSARVPLAEGAAEAAAVIHAATQVRQDPSPVAAEVEIRTDGKTDPVTRDDKSGQGPADV